MDSLMKIGISIPTSIEISKIAHARFVKETSLK
jgi:hypothetical protein